MTPKKKATHVKKKPKLESILNDGSSAPSSSQTKKTPGKATKKAKGGGEGEGDVEAKDEEEEEEQYK
jgi:hypothetical protein